MGDVEGDAATRRVTWRPGDGDGRDGAAGEWAHGCRQDLALSGPDGEEAPAVSLAATLGRDGAEAGYDSLANCGDFVGGPLAPSDPNCHGSYKTIVVVGRVQIPSVAAHLSPAAGHGAL